MAGSGRARRVADRDLTTLSERLAQWRRWYGGRGRRLPAWVWKAATKLSQTRGVGSVSRALGLSAASLVRRLPAGGEPAPRPTDARRPAFVELARSSIQPSERCVVEIVGRGGCRLTITVANAKDLDLPGLCGLVVGADR